MAAAVACFLPTEPNMLRELLESGRLVLPRPIDLLLEDFGPYESLLGTRFRSRSLSRSLCLSLSLWLSMWSVDRLWLS